MTKIKPDSITLNDIFDTCHPAAVAVSGGVDSMTLAFVAHRAMGQDVTMFHAVSPAVPPSATERVRAYADREGWQLRVLNAGEFVDENYMSNPANRCFFCKSNLYGSLSSATDAQLFSGTNLDDLEDWRPGLQAAENHKVRHPFVEAGLTKNDVRALAREHNLTDLAELPSAPCLSSRVATGIRIDAEALRSIDRTETLLREALSPQTVRCRIRDGGIVIELDQDSLEQLDDQKRASLSADIRHAFSHPSDTTITLTAYQRGSAFLRETLHKQ
jgi:uncharacterized protein